MGNTCIPMADSCECMAKATTILQSNSPPIKEKKSMYETFSKQKSPFFFSTKMKCLGSIVDSQKEYELGQSMGTASWQHPIKKKKKILQTVFDL